MILKQLALTEHENTVLFELVSGEIRSGFIYGQDRDMIEIQRILLGLYDQLELFEPPTTNDTKKIKGAPPVPNPTYKTTRRLGKGDMQEEQQI